MKKQFKDLFLKALWVGIKGLMALPILFLIIVIYDSINVYHPEGSYSIQIFQLLTIMIVLAITLLIISSIKLWKFLLLCILLIVYTLMYYFNEDIQYSRQLQNCLERPTQCIDKEVFEEVSK